MRHLKARTKLNMTASHRKALFRNLANALFDHERIRTTNSKAMELRRVAERLITLAKKNDLHATRLAFAFLRNKEMVKKLFADIGSRYTDISGGYTRVVKIGRRKGDAAPMAVIELTQRKEQEKEKKKGEGKKTKEKKSRASKTKEAKQARPGEEAKEQPKKEAKPGKARAKKGEAEAGEKKPRARKTKKAESEGTES